MVELLDLALSWLGDLLWSAFTFVSGFFLQFFPDADQGIVSVIRGWGNIVSGASMTFNVFYFVDMGVVSVFLGMAFTVALAYLVLAMVKGVIALVQKLIEVIPVVE